MNGGKMDQYVTGASCSSPNNFAYADPTLIMPYHTLASQNAMADRYFQPNAGQSSSNDMFLFTASFVFKDNSAAPDALGKMCGLGGTASTFTDKTIGDLLDGAKVSWTWYAQGYDVMKKAQAQGGSCPDSDPMCPAMLPIYPCVWDGGDYPVEYYAQFRDQDKYIRDYASFANDLKSSNLPQVAYVRGLGFRSEHPGVGTTISDGEKFVNEVITAVQASVYAADTVVFVAWDEGGGYFDHVAPPGKGSDGQPYGTRIPFIAIGPQVRKNYVSHVQMEHSSVVKFIEWNWLGGQTGQLGARDANVNNLGDLFDSSSAGTIPVN
jgi:phospholipase C